MSLHLAEIGREVSPGAHAVLVLDGAGWHGEGGRLRVPPNTTLLRLPPYAPELSPVENLRAHLRGNTLSHRVSETCDAILDACTEAWNRLVAQPDRLASFSSRPRARVSQRCRAYYESGKSAQRPEERRSRHRASRDIRRQPASP